MRNLDHRKLPVYCSVYIQLEKYFFFPYTYMCTYTKKGIFKLVYRALRIYVCILYILNLK